MSVSERTEAELGATMGLAFLAADFCMEPETFPVFLEWARTRGEVIPLDWTPTKLAPLVHNLQKMMYMARAGA